MNEEERLSRMQAYLEGTMSQEEKDRFESEINKDQSLKTELEQLRTIDSDLLELGKKRVGINTSAWEKEYREALEAPPSGFFLRKYMSVAAVILIVAVAGIYLLRPAGDTDLYASYYEPYPDMVTMRGEAEESLFTEGMDAYNDGEYSIAAEKLSEYIRTDRNPLAYLYLGISFMELGEWYSAEMQFRNASSFPTTRDQSIWYSGLLFLKKDQKELAISKFYIISREPDHYKHSEAVSILGELN